MNREDWNWHARHLRVARKALQHLAVPFKDGRRIAAQRHRAALQQTKPEMARTMIARAQRAGIEALYLLADAWFGIKPMIAMAEDALLTAKSAHEEEHDEIPPQPGHA